MNIIEKPEGLADVVRLAKEAGFWTEVQPVWEKHEQWIGTSEELERFAALVRAEELEAVYEEFYLCITSDLEHGVKSSNERAADKFKKEYPQLYKFWEWMNIRMGEYEGEEE